MAGDLEMTFDELFVDSPKDSQKNSAGRLAGDSNLPPKSPMSPMYPKAPNPTTTASPVFTPRVIRAPWNYTNELKEAFPDAKFSRPLSPEGKILQGRLRLQELKSPSPREVRRLEKHVMGGASLTSGQQKALKPKFTRLPGAAKDEANGVDPVGTIDDANVERKQTDKDEGKGKNEGNQTDKRKENVFSDLGKDDSSDESEVDDYDSDDFDETPYEAGIGSG